MLNDLKVGLAVIIASILVLAVWGFAIYGAVCIYREGLIL